MIYQALQGLKRHMKMKKKEKAIKKYDKLLRSCIDNKDIVKVERDFGEGDVSVLGFLLDISQKFLLMQKEEDFYLDGYAIIPKGQFDSIRNNKFDKTHKKILAKEGITKRDYGIDIKVDLTDWPGVFKSLRKHDQYVIIECEDLDEPIFLIGPITRVGKKTVSVQYFDATGLLDEKPSAVNYSDITIVRFDERYINVFRKHLRQKKKK